VAVDPEEEVRELSLSPPRPAGRADGRAGATRTLEVHGHFQGGADPYDELVYLLSPLRSWAAAGPVHVHVTTPKSWSVVLGFDQGWIEAPDTVVPGTWKTSVADGAVTRSTTLLGTLPGRLVVRWDGE